jgi:hypothetical protein
LYSAAKTEHNGNEIWANYYHFKMINQEGTGPFALESISLSGETDADQIRIKQGPSKAHHLNFDRNKWLLCIKNLTQQSAARNISSRPGTLAFTANCLP